MQTSALPRNSYVALTSLSLSAPICKTGPIRLGPVRMHVKGKCKVRPKLRPGLVLSTTPSGLHPHELQHGSQAVLGLETSSREASVPSRYPRRRESKVLSWSPHRTWGSGTDLNAGTTLHHQSGSRRRFQLPPPGGSRDTRWPMRREGTPAGSWLLGAGAACSPGCLLLPPAAAPDGNCGAEAGPGR